MSKFAFHADELTTAPPFTVSTLVDVLYDLPDSTIKPDGWNGNTLIALKATDGLHMCYGIELYPTSKVMLMACSSPYHNCPRTDFRTLVNLVSELAGKHPGSGGWSIQATHPTLPTMYIKGVHMSSGVLVLEAA